MKKEIKNRLYILLFVVVCITNASAGNISQPKEFEYVAGIVKQAGNGRISFPAEVVSPSAGMIQCWVKLNKSPARLKYNHLWGVGFNKPGWFTSCISESKFSVITKNSEVSSNCSIDISHWKIGEWHNLAVCWGTYRDKSMLLIYEDGTLKAKLKEALLPQEFNSGDLCLGYNSASYKDDDFAGAIDEFVVYSLPQSPKVIKNNFLLGRNAKAMVPAKGVTMLVNFDDNTDIKAGEKSTLDGKDLKKHLRATLITPQVRKYEDMLSAHYSYNRAIKEKSPNILMDGSDKSNISWKDKPLEIIFDLAYTCDISLIEIAAPKHTIWYRLEELSISLDNGSGEFSEPEIIKAYGTEPTQTKKVVDETCKVYIYQWKPHRRACRIKIIAQGKAHMSIGEVRICGNPAR